MKTPSTSTPETKSAPHHYWRRTKRLTTALLLCWGLLSFFSLFFARELSEWHFFSWPLSFYLAAQGLTLSYVLILAIYSIGMRWIQRPRQDDKNDKDE
ncbi:DUF4212 domain-containing protein [Undibacterium sp. 14-3-2]|uniref:DUF4212 domain-containing protein n=1 Tax=Undibacterium sp. 14-3-2 TaxID=2800129 RepID=UPI0019080753|nr:DUF4212 domain-containing protein [Undibacterium sp. 14-3-2]MBK1889212.1 DUF4212 domain-containing protein [Undibacterium sp. 14-3-2]MBY0569883.1 DUF4212 domain-containing protein [Burkholderiaceae bacterium]